MNDQDKLTAEGLRGWGRIYVKRGDFDIYAKARDAGKSKAEAFAELRAVILPRIRNERAASLFPKDCDVLTPTPWPFDEAVAEGILAAKPKRAAAPKTPAPAPAPKTPAPAPAPKTPAPAPIAPTAPKVSPPKEAPKEAPKAAPKEAPKAAPTREMVSAVMAFTNFCKDCEFVPQARILNTLAHLPSVNARRDYLVSYFALTNNSYLATMTEKVKCAEFAKVAVDIGAIAPAKRINTRLEIFYGVPGSGKTTAAMRENPEAAVVVCNASTSPDELFRGFSFVDGKPAFVGSPLRDAMVEGKVVILDEINLLGMECLRALQAIADNKPTAVVGTEEIRIKEGFKIVGTMNLHVDDAVVPLPSPLVDRCGNIREFAMDADALAAAAYC